ncbi:MAG: hypothetical protein KGL16_02630 [Acidobacteriota bacterium]|nr:hypothetical protein [Acidobacteriota bacterium]
MPIPMRARLLATSAVLGATLIGAAGAAAHEHHHRGRHARRLSSGQFSASVFAQGASISHPTAGGSAAVSKPDDITYLHDRIFVAFQNGVGAQGEASASGNGDSTIVEFSRSGQELAQWDITGKCDGLAADPQTGQLIATVNEDANSSVYLIDPHPGSTPVDYQYSQPLPSAGGTDAVSVYHGTVLISASAPGTTAPAGTTVPQASYPAVYAVWFDANSHTAYVNGLFGDEAPALVANTDSTSFGSLQSLALTDPDSNAVVPAYARRFGGDFMLNSQGDQQQIFYRDPWQPPSVLSLSAAVDDTAWPSGRGGVLYVTDNSADQIIAVTGPFQTGSEIVAVTPCGSNSAPASCPAPGYPADYLGSVDPGTGAISQLALSGPSFAPHGLLFVPGREHR